MADLIDRKATIDYFITNLGWYDECDNPIYDSDEKRKYITEFISGVTPVDAVPIKWIKEWIDKHETDCNTVESMLMDWMEVKNVGN